MGFVKRAVALLPALVVGAVLAVACFSAVGAVGGVASLLAVALVLAVVTYLPNFPERRFAGRILVAGLALVPGALTVYLSFSAGGFFPTEPALLVVALATTLVVRTVLTTDPFEGLSWPVLVAAAALAGYAAWTLASGTWSGAPARASVESNRVLLYLLALLLFASIPRTPWRLRWTLRFFVLGIVVVCVGALVTRVLPEVWRAPALFEQSRLSYPLTYWNALGLLAALGVILCFHLASDPREIRAVRVLGAAFVPLLGASLLLTLSRGAIVVGVGGLGIYLLVGRPRALLSGALAAGPPTVLAVRATYDAPLLFSPEYLSPAGIAQGASTAWVLAAYAVLAALIRLALLPVDGPLARLRLPDRMRWPVVGGAAAVGLVAAIVVLATLDAPDTIAAQYERFVGGADYASSGDIRGRLSDAASPDRIAHWQVALEDYREAPLAGQGAGMHGLSWEERRPTPTEAIDAHSIYLESLAELGIVGFVLLGVSLLTILLTLLVRARGPDRPVYGALLAAAVAWTVHAGIDWDWEMPAVTLWLFALGGAAMAAPARELGRRPRPRTRTLRRAPGLRATVALTSLLLALPASLLAQSETRLLRAQEAFRDRDCLRAAVAARDSLSAVGTRPEPYEILGLCAMRFGFERRGVERLEQAVRRDPRDWRFRYGLALARGGAGLDPRPAAAAALRLNPLQPLAREAVRRFATDDPRAWRRAAREASLRGELDD